MRFALILPALLVLASCGADEVTVSKRPDVSYARVEPAAGMTYKEYRQHETWGQGDVIAAQRRFLMLDRNNDGRLTEDELGAASP